MKKNRRSNKLRQANEGVALIGALGILIVLSLLGTAYLKYATIDVQQMRNATGQVRAQYAASGAVQAMIGELEAALDSGKIEEFLKNPPKSIDLPQYHVNRRRGLEADTTVKSTISVEIEDECAKVNLNCASTRILSAILGISGEQARKLRASLPHPGEEAGKLLWLGSVDDLVTRGFLTPAAFRKIDKSLLTTQSVADPANASSYINVNTAPEKVLQAVFNLTPEESRKVVNARPFTTFADLVAATGKDPATFNVQVDPDNPDAVPRAITFTSNSFRIRARATLRDDGEGWRARSEVEAVVVFPLGKKPIITYWTERNVAMGDEKDQQEAVPVKAASAAEKAVKKPVAGKTAVGKKSGKPVGQQQAPAERRNRRG